MSFFNSTFDSVDKHYQHQRYDIALDNTKELLLSSSKCGYNGGRNYLDLFKLVCEDDLLYDEVVAEQPTKVKLKQVEFYTDNNAFFGLSDKALYIYDTERFSSLLKVDCIDTCELFYVMETRDVLLAASNFGNVQIIDLNVGNLIRTTNLVDYEATTKVVSIQPGFNAENDFLCSTTDNIYLWDIRNLSEPVFNLFTNNNDPEISQIKLHDGEIFYLDSRGHLRNTKNPNNILNATMDVSNYKNRFYKNKMLDDLFFMPGAFYQPTFFNLKNNQTTTFDNYTIKQKLHTINWMLPTEKFVLFASEKYPIQIMSNKDHSFSSETFKRPKGQGLAW